MENYTILDHMVTVAKDSKHKFTPDKLEKIERIKLYIALNPWIKKKTNAPKVSHPRFYVYHELRMECDLKLRPIYEMFKTDHATVIHGIKMHGRLLNDKLYQEEIRDIYDFLNK